MLQKIFIICEGKSEEKYINYLSQILIKNGIFDLRLISYPFYGSKTYSRLIPRIKEKIDEIKSDERDISSYKIYIWLDKDIFINKYRTKKEVFEKDISSIKLPTEIEILYNTMNFEDFLILHYDKKIIKELQVRLCGEKHFERPLISTNYLKIFNIFIKSYSKGSLPSSLEVDEKILKLCLDNINNSKYNFYSDFKNILCIIIDKLAI